MDQAAIQAHISRGLAKAGLIVGAGLVQYRPTTSWDPLLEGSALQTLFCAVAYDQDLTLATAAPPDHPFGHLLADPGQVQTGDYLIGSDTYFVSRIEPLRPAWCVLCNMVLNVLDTAQPTVAGTNAYGGVTSATNTMLARGWPMSVLSKTRGGQDVTKLPSDTRSAFFEVLLPLIPGVTLQAGLSLQDNLAQTYSVMNVETTDYGCKLLVGLATT